MVEDIKEESYHWADLAAEKVIAEKGDKKKYTVAAGITPSGTVHIGNFREIITVDLVKRALEKKGKKVRFIYSWDEYDVFRKVPKNMPQQEILLKHLRFPVVDTPDTFGCHKSYAEHLEKEIEESVPKVGIYPTFLYQAQKYRSGEYNKEIKKALEHNEEIKKCLNEYREEDVDENWLPISLFCEKCHKDTIKELKWLGGYSISYTCDCGHKDSFDFNTKPIVKLKWRVDWHMRWNYEQVDFEPGGKDHSTVGGSYDTGKKIVKAVWNFDAPTYVMYDFIQVKGGAGKMSSSSGNVITLNDVLEIYEPEIVRWIFAGTRPNKEFAISFDTDVLKLYEDFDKCERIYFGAEQVNEKEAVKQKVAYELSAIGKLPKIIPYQAGFRHLTTLLQIYSLDVKKTIAYFKKELKNAHDTKRLKKRVECAKNWLEKYAPEEFKFTIQDTCQVSVTPEQNKILHRLAEKLLQREWTDVELHEEIYILCKNINIPPPEFFKIAYQVLINKERGPRLAAFILAVGKEKVARLLKNLIIEGTESSTTLQKKTDAATNYQPIGGILEIQDEVLQKFPGLKVGIAIIKGVTVRKEMPELERFKKEVVGKLIEEFKTKELENIPVLEEYKRIYRATGVDPTKQKPSPLALLKRIKEGKELYTVNTVVDVYNLVVMKTQVSMGAFDLRNLKFPTYLRFAKEGEKFTPLLEDKPKLVKEGELVYADQEELIFCRDLNYRDSDFTKITEKTRDLILYVDGTQVTSNQELQEAMNLAIKWIIKYCGGKVEKIAYTF
ncbi:MAG TPA: lysine--tRNA ligase [Candidatus Nanoarchaeia archaeon]|nr:lysine--tRNA ligase [Candidatus Nanoarchaeia archaeon]